MNFKTTSPLTLLLLAIAQSSYALSDMPHCFPDGGSTRTLDVNLHDQFSTLNSDRAGSWSNANVDAGFSMLIRCPKTTGAMRTLYRFYIARIPYASGRPINTDSNTTPQYRRINEYLSISTMIYDNKGQRYYLPYIAVPTDMNEGIHPQRYYRVSEDRMYFTIKVEKPFIGNTSFNIPTLYEVRAATTFTLPNIQPIYTIAVNGNVQVNANCQVDAGTIMKIDFGDVQAQNFEKTGFGQKPADINEEERILNIQCSNGMSSQARLHLRLTTTNRTRNDTIIASGNGSVGFKVADSNGKVLIPNNTQSFIQTQLTNNLVQAKLKFWPVSAIYGVSPPAGSYKATATIRIDLD